MKTKCEIVQSLLNDKKITAEEAVVLLTSEKEYVYINNPYPFPTVPYVPYGPIWYADPFPGRITVNDFPSYSTVSCPALN